MKIKFPCHDITLEGVFGIPEGNGPFGLVVVCHPHPLYGGNMYNNVVHAICEKLGERGLAWLKFNFRGVGNSGGRFGEGIGEQDDAGAAISFAEKHGKIDAGKIGICGYSFGSTIAFAVAVSDGRIQAVAGISPFVQPADLLDHYKRPKLFITGTNDEFINPQSLEQLVLKLPEPKELAIYPRVDHFWGGSEDSMAEKVSQFFKESFEFQVSSFKLKTPNL
jgi:alpha/beta superfamily hydrolase